MPTENAGGTPAPQGNVAESQPTQQQAPQGVPNQTLGTLNGTEGRVEQPTGVEWSRVDVNQIPEDVIKNHPLFKNVLTESIQRRQQLQQLKSTLEDKPVETNKPAENKPQSDEPPAWAKTILDEIAASKQAALDTAKTNVMTEFGLPPEMAEFVTGSTAAEMRAKASKLAALSKTPGSPANAGKVGDSAFFGRVDALLNGYQDPLKAPGLKDVEGLRQSSVGFDG